MIALYKGVSMLSRLIEAVNFSPYSHVSYVDEDELTEYEAWIPDGVREQDFGSAHSVGTVIDLYDVFLTAHQAEQVRAFLEAEIGAPYDYRGLLGFLGRRRIESPSAWFCSELVCAAFERAHRPLLARLPPWRSYPGLLVHSPELSFRRSVRIMEGGHIEDLDSSRSLRAIRRAGC